MREGYFAAHIRRMRLMYREQRDALAQALARHAGGHVRVDVPDQGMHLVAHLRAGVSDLGIEAAARERDIVVRAMSRFYLAAPRRSALMLGFSGFPPQVIKPAAARLAAVITRAAAASRCSA
jgi:GntR family transcriptional regulator / MocR family aminotransferase